MLKKQAKVLTIVGALLAAVIVAPLASAESPHFTANYVRGLQDMKMMKMMDADSDGKVTKEEFMKYQEAMFDMMDKGKKGYLTKDDWTRSIAATGTQTN